VRIYLVDANGIVTSAVDGASRGVDGFQAVAAEVYQETVVGQPLPWPRAMRNQLLADTDFVEMPSYFGRLTDDQKTAWRVYRDALRNITTAFQRPIDVIWPQRPDAKPTVENVSLLPPLTDAEKAALEFAAQAALRTEQDMWQVGRPPPVEMPIEMPQFTPPTTDPGPDVAEYHARLEEHRRAAEQYAAQERERQQNAPIIDVTTE